MQLAGSLLEGPFGLKERQVNRLRQKDIWITYEGESKPLALELAYACGILNSWKSDTEKAIGTILLLSSILDHDYEDRCNAVKVCAKEWGASRFISYKIALLKSVDPERDPQSDILKDIDTLLGHDESPEIQYSAIENVLSSISLFSVAKRHTNTLKSKMGQNFRSRHSLSNLVATPFSEADASDFLRRNHETCLLDCVHAIWVILNLADRFPESRAAVERNLDAGLFEALETARSTVGAQKLPSIFQSLENQTLGNDDASLLLYRQSSIFLEFPEICRFRNDLDRVIGLRLISNLLPRIRQWPCNALDDIEVLKRPNSQFDFSKHNQEDVNIDVFYRTYLFLKFIQEPMNLAYITEEDIRFVFDNTIGLDSLLLESELQSMHLNAPD